MKRLLIAASALGLVVLVTLGARATAASPTSSPAHACDATAIDDPVPVECPFCGGDPMLHVRRMNNIAVITSRLAYRVMDASLF